LSQAKEDLRNMVEKLKTIYGSGFKGLHDLAKVLDENYVSTLGRLNSTISMHASTLENVRLLDICYIRFARIGSLTNLFMCFCSLLIFILCHATSWKNFSICGGIVG
jgi:hypothetical protein